METKQTTTEFKEYVPLYAMSRMLMGKSATATPSELQEFFQQGIFSFGAVIKVRERLKFNPELTERDIIAHRAKLAVQGR